MKQKTVLNFLIPLIAIIAAAAALTGLLMQGGDGPTAFTTLRGQTADIYGWGLYRFDTVFFAATFKGTDVVTLVLSIPLLIVAFIIPTAVIVHDYWTVEDPRMQQIERSQFMKNLSMAGGALIIFYLYNQGQDLPLSVTDALFGPWS